MQMLHPVLRAVFLTFSMTNGDLLPLNRSILLESFRL